MSIPGRSLHYKAMGNYERLIESPVGPLTLRAEDGALTAILFGDMRKGLPGGTRVLEQAAAELAEYFEGSRREFTVPVRLTGTDFQQEVWAALCEIPYGATATYGDIARRVGRPRACRAVGMANHRNPVPIIVPCHRVIGSGGALTGYGGGLAVKSYLLAWEKENL